MTLPQKLLQSMKQQATNVLATGQRFKRFDQIRQRHFWSTFRVTPDVNGYIESGNYEIFQTIVGQMGQGFPFPLTLVETNWQGNNRVPDNQNFIITEFGVSARTCFIQLEKDSSGILPGSYAFQDFNMANYAQAEGQILDNATLNITYLTNTIPLGMCTDFAQPSAPWLGFYAPSMPIFAESAPGVFELPGAFESTTADFSRTFVSNGLPAPGLRRKLKIPILLQHGEAFRMSVIIETGRGPFISPINPALAPEDFAGEIAFDIRVDFWATESFVEKG